MGSTWRVRLVWAPLGGWGWCELHLESGAGVGSTWRVGLVWAPLGERGWCGLHSEGGAGVGSTWRGGVGVGSTWRARLGRKRNINLFIFLMCLVALILSSVSYYFRACSFTEKLLRKDYREIQ